MSPRYTRPSPTTMSDYYVPGIGIRPRLVYSRFMATTPNTDTCGHCGSNVAVAYIGETAVTCGYRICQECLDAGVPSEFAVITLDSEVDELS